MYDRSCIFQDVYKFAHISSRAEETSLFAKIKSELNSSEDATEFVNYVQAYGPNAGKSVLWLTFALKRFDLVDLILARSDISSNNLNAIAKEGADRGKSVLWLAAQYIHKSEECKERFFRLLDLSNIEAINSVYTHLLDGTNTSVLIRALEGSKAINEQFDICCKLLLKGANIEPKVFTCYQDYIYSLSLHLNHGTCKMEFSEQNILKDNLQEKINAIITNFKQDQIAAYLKAITTRYDDILKPISNLSDLIQRPWRDGEGGKSHFIYDSSCQIISLVCNLVKKPLDLYADELNYEQLLSLKKYLQILSTPQCVVLINYLQNPEAINFLETAEDASALANILSDTCLYLSLTMLHIAEGKECLMDALEICFSIPSFDNNLDVLDARRLLATCYVQRDSKILPTWKDSELQGTFAEVSRRIRDYEAPDLQSKKRAKITP